MTLDELIPSIEALQAEGAFVLLKWDGERTSRRCTVVITREDTDFIWRKDCDQVPDALAEAIAAYRRHHSH